MSQCNCPELCTGYCDWFPGKLCDTIKIKQKQNKHAECLRAVGDTRGERLRFRVSEIVLLRDYSRISCREIAGSAKVQVTNDHMCDLYLPSTSAIGLQFQQIHSSNKTPFSQMKWAKPDRWACVCLLRVSWWMYFAIRDGEFQLSMKCC